MDPEMFENLAARMGTSRVTRMAAIRGLLGGAAVALSAAGVAPSAAAAAKGTQKAAKRRKAQKRKVQGNASIAVPATEPAPVPQIDKPSMDPIIIEDPCDAFSDIPCGAS